MVISEQLLIILHITIVGLFLECWIILSKRCNSLHTFLGLSCLAALINNTGYLLELTSHSEGAYVAALKFSYLGRIWYAFFLVLFIAEFVHVKLPGLLKAVLVILHSVIYMFIINLQSHRLYYYDIHFQSYGLFPVLIHKNGILHHVLMALQLFYIVLGMSLLIRAFIKGKSRYMRRRILIVIAAILVESIFFIIQLIGIPGITYAFDVTMLGYFIGTIIMMIAILSFDLLGTREIARDFLVDRLSEGIIAVDNDGIIQYINEPIYKLYPALADSKNEEAKTATMNEIITASKDGSSITINDRIYSAEENNLVFRGEIVGKIYALMDDTDHFKYMEELKEQRKMADSANVAKSRFLANMSHEIRTPINAVLGMDEMILRESKEKQIRSYAADILSAGRTLLSLINDILDLSKVEEGKMEIIPVQYDLSSLINDLSNLISERAKKKGLNFTISVNEHTPNLLLGDEIRIRQCVTNLLTNAVKYTESGSVSMEISYEPIDDEHIRLGFSISDTGIGMKNEDMEKLFSPYQRIEEKRNRMIEGTGLGMSITRQLLDLMGSQLHVISEYGKGSVFAFKVEQGIISHEAIGDITQRLNNLTAEITDYRELFHAPDAKILVIDDTDMNLTVIKSLLKQTRIMIDTALSGKEGLELAKINKYDVIFIDHMMPDMDGIETLKQIRLSGQNTKTHAVALTANAVSGARQMYLSAGFDDYLSKPIDSLKLERMLYDMIPDEKILSVDKDSSAYIYENDIETEDKRLDQLKAIEQLDINEGLNNCGNTDGYFSVLKVFHQTAASKADEIEKLYSSKDTENYTIKVHALKSSARIIGAKELSKLAEELEIAAKNNDQNRIEEDTDRLLSMYRSLDEKLSMLETDDKKKKSITPEMMNDAYQAINELSQSMDHDTVECIINDLKDYDLTPEDAARIRDIENALIELEWDKIIKLSDNSDKS